MSRLGLFGIVGLHAPADFSRLAEVAIQRCASIVAAVPLLPPGADVVRALDDVSDIVCGVLDPAEFCRQAHTERAFSAAADATAGRLVDYVQALNADASLYHALLRSMEGRAGAGLSEAERRVAVALKHDFHVRGAAHLPECKRVEVAAVAARVRAAERRFASALGDPAQLGAVRLPQSATSALPPAWRRWAQGGDVGRHGWATVSCAPTPLAMLLRWLPEASSRRAAWAAAAATPTSTPSTLDDLLASRSELASLVGVPSPAHAVLAGSLAGGPATVAAFLESLGHHLAPHVAREEALLVTEAELGGMGTRCSGQRGIAPWDRSVLTAQVRARLTANAQSGAQGSTAATVARALDDVYPLAAALDGVRALLGATWGIVATPTAMAPGEAWAPGVMKWKTHDARTSRPLGTLYVDVQSRPGKPSGCALYTLSRTAVVLSAGFCPGGALCHSELEVLLHETGHAAHALLSCVGGGDLHQAGAARGALDAVEIPSHLFEHFVWDPRSLAVLKSGGAAPRGIPISSPSSPPFRRPLVASELQMQVVLASLDAACHGPGGAPTQERGVSDILGELIARWLPGQAPAPGEGPARWHARFSHLGPYGGAYYCYPFAAAVAGAVWDAHLADDPLSRTLGDGVVDGLLKHGNAADPARLLRGLLGPDAGGDVAAGFVPDVRPWLRQMGLSAG